MSRSAILGGTVMANTVRSMIALVAMLMGLLVGFRPEADLGGWLAVLGLMVLLSYAFSWLLAIIGLIAGSEEAAYQMSALLWPLAFASSAFVPPESMPSPLEDGTARAHRDPPSAAELAEVLSEWNVGLGTLLMWLSPLAIPGLSL
jgi:ABC-type multidrug transport system permease subunit